MRRPCKAWKTGQWLLKHERSHTPCGCGQFTDTAVAGALLKQIHQPPPTAPALRERLSGREYTILQRIVAGMSNAQIADDLQLSDGTVRN